MKKIFLVSLVVLASGCTNVMQTESISDAYNSYAAKKFEKTLKFIGRAEHIREANPELRAELTYLKAQAYEEMGQYEVAVTLYEYLKAEHSNSQYGYLAAERLEKKNG